MGTRRVTGRASRMARRTESSSESVEAAGRSRKGIFERNDEKPSASPAKGLTRVYSVENIGDVLQRQLDSRHAIRGQAQAPMIRAVASRLNSNDELDLTFQHGLALVKCDEPDEEKKTAEKKQPMRRRVVEQKGGKGMLLEEPLLNMPSSAQAALDAAAKVHEEEALRMATALASHDDGDSSGTDSIMDHDGFFRRNFKRSLDVLGNLNPKGPTPRTVERAVGRRRQPSSARVGGSEGEHDVMVDRVGVSPGRGRHIQVVQGTPERIGIGATRLGVAPYVESMSPMGGTMNNDVDGSNVGVDKSEDGSLVDDIDIHSEIAGAHGSRGGSERISMGSTRDSPLQSPMHSARRPSATAASVATSSRAVRETKGLGRQRRRILRDGVDNSPRTFVVRQAEREASLRSQLEAAPLVEPGIASQSGTFALTLHFDICHRGSRPAWMLFGCVCVCVCVCCIAIVWMFQCISVELFVLCRPTS